MKQKKEIIQLLYYQMVKKIMVLPMKKLTFDWLGEAVMRTFDMVATNEWTQAKAKYYLQTEGIKTILADCCIKHANNRFKLVMLAMTTQIMMSGIKNIQIFVRNLRSQISLQCGGLLIRWIVIFYWRMYAFTIPW